jgi:glycerol uptake facilitator
MTETTRLFIGEFLGTMILILLGDGVVAGVLLKRSKAENSGWLVITTGWAIAVLCGIVTSIAFGGKGYINPVAPICEMVTGKLASNLGLACIIGEFAGAFVGAILVWLHYMPHWTETPESELKLAVFCTGPAIRQPAANLFSEMLGTFVLVFVASAMSSPKITGHPALIGALVWGIGLGLGGTTGYAINPARDFSPRLVHAILPIPGKGGSDWGYAWIPILGPIVGGISAALLANYLTPILA